MTLDEIKAELSKLGYGFAFASRGIIAFDADANALPIRVDEDGVLKVQIEGLYDGTTRTPVAVDINGKIENSATITAHVDDLETLTQTLIDQGKYAPSGYDDTTTAGYVYTFWEDKDGAWFIRKTPTSSGTTTYAAGSSGAAAAFADPAGQVYDTYSETF